MRWPGAVVAVSLVLVACGGEASRPAGGAPEQSSGKKSGAEADACALLTPEEIEASAGWKPDSAEPKTYGTTRTCQYQGPPPKVQSVVVVVARPAPELSSSAEMAQWRTKQAARQPDIKVVVTPVEGLGAPAIRSEVDGIDTPTVEAAVGGRILGITAPSFEAAKALAAKAIPRLR